MLGGVEVEVIIMPAQMVNADEGNDEVLEVIDEQLLLVEVEDEEADVIIIDELELVD